MKCPLNVLFVGNSHLYYNDLKQTIEELAPGCINAVEISSGGATLNNHLNNPIVVDLLRDGPGDGKPWDWFVMQPNSVEPILLYPGGEGLAGVNKALFLSAGTQLAALARAGLYGSAKVMLHGVAAKAYPWIWYAFDYPDVGATPAQQSDLINASFEELSVLIKDDGGSLVIPPIVQAWLGGDKGRCGISESFLFERFDDNHPTPVGSYLTAVFLWRSLTGCSTRGRKAITNAQPSWPVGQRGLVVTPTLAHCAQQSADTLVRVPPGCKTCKCKAPTHHSTPSDRQGPQMRDNNIDGNTTVATRPIYGYD